MWKTTYGDDIVQFVFLEILQENKIGKVIDDLAQLTFMSKSQLFCHNLFPPSNWEIMIRKTMLMWPQIQVFKNCVYIACVEGN